MDLLLRNARLLGADDVTDIAVEAGRISSIGPTGVPGGVRERTEGAVEIDLEGRLVTPPLVEPHIHLDAVLTVGQPRPNVSGSLFEGIAVWAERVRTLTAEDVQQRVRQVVRWEGGNGGPAGRGPPDGLESPPPPLRGPGEVGRE